MHYKNGREVKIGDHVVGLDYNNRPTAGVVAATQESGGCCMLGIVPVDKIRDALDSSKFLHVEDAFAVPQPPASEVPPPPAEG